MNLLRISILSLLIISLGTSCVSKKKYTELKTLKTSIQNLLDDKDKSFENLLEEKRGLANELSSKVSEKESLENRANFLKNRESDLLSQIEEQKEKNQLCEDERMKILEKHSTLKSQSTKKMRKMIDEMEDLQRDLAIVQQDLTAREKRIDQVEKKLYQRDSIMFALKRNLSNALLGFSDKGLTVEHKNNKVYVSLSNKLLFKSGSSDIDESGVDAIIQLTEVLKTQTDLSIIVEGHTDDDPIKTAGRYTDNWDLSVIRSTSVVRIMVENGLDPMQVLPAGRGEFTPVGLNDTPENKAANRRTEIILSPKLDELFQLIGDK